jgi:hypothetical protein
MCILRLLSLTCRKTQESRDEPYVVVYVDGVRQVSTDWHDMDDGDSLRLDEAPYHLPPISFRTRAEVQLWEHDRVGNDDHLGTLVVTRAYPGIGEVARDIRSGNAHYVITFDVTADLRTRNDFEIELTRLVCNDAQEHTDSPYLKINGEDVWGPIDMRTGNEQPVGVTRPFHRNVRVELWERDAHVSDHFGTMTLLLADAQERARTPRTEFPVTFSKDRGIIGDARYTLYYRIRGR